MPIVIPKDIPAYESLDSENIFVMNDTRADSQDIRPIEIAIVNLMPTKIETETQLLRLLANSPIQINPTFIKMDSYTSKNVSQTHMERFYLTFDQIKERKFDGMIVTGAPVETMNFEEVAYWDELTKVMDYAEKNVTSTIYICWASQAALYHFYGINKHGLKNKLFGIYPNIKLVKFEPLLNGLDDRFYIPQSRHTSLNEKLVYANPDLVCLAKSNIAGLGIIKSKDNSKVFITGHIEYDKFTISNEYNRDLTKGLEIKRPYNYYEDSSNTTVKVLWRSTGSIVFSNWLNYYVYQITPYDITSIKK